MHVGSPALDLSSCPSLPTEGTFFIALTAWRILAAMYSSRSRHPIPDCVHKQILIMASVREGFEPSGGVRTCGVTAGKQSGLQTHIAVTESVLLCVRMKN
jgi:hypothetical protein